MEEKRFTDFVKLKEDMFQHVKKNGSVDLEIFNEPQKLFWGWLDKKSNTRWLIRASDFRYSTNKFNINLYSYSKYELCKSLEKFANKALIND